MNGVHLSIDIRARIFEAKSSVRAFKKPLKCKHGFRTSQLTLKTPKSVSIPQRNFHVYILN